MASVFLSYDHDDAPRVSPITSALEQAGHEVWWDRHIHGGSEYVREIEAAVENAQAVVVLWSKRSVDSAWVRDEAAEGRDQRKLVPVLIDSVKPPMGFRQFQAIDLSPLKGRLKPDRWQEILACIDRLAGEPQQRVEAPAGRASTSMRFPSRWILAAAAAVFALIGASYFLLGRAGEASAPVVTVAAADDSPPSKSLADDLFIKLGNLQTTNADALQLVEQGSDADPDLRFRVAQKLVDGQAQATVALLGGNGSLLWSREFRQHERPMADLQQQISYSAALVLACATDAMAPGHDKLEEMTLKLYLGGCSRLSDEFNTDPGSLVEVFEKVTRQAPDFQGGWAKLLMVETDSWLRSERDPALGRTLAAHIRRARMLNANMAEAYVSEAWMQELRQINRWMPMSKAAVDKNPSNAFALTEHANDMLQVGRLRQAVTYARRAVQADPLSPWVRDSLVTALVNAGEIEAAKDALEEAERLWPGASNLVPHRFFLAARYGDPRQARELLRSGKVSLNLSPAMESFLEARIDPSPAKVDRAVMEARNVSDRWPGPYIQTLAEFGRKEELLQFLAEYDPGPNVGPATVFLPGNRTVQNDVRFMAIMNRWGQLDYWRKSGEWPDFCMRPDLPYDCKAEAAKLARAAS